MPRDDFTQAVLETLSKRVALHCSNPGCRKQTAGPRTESDATVNIGVGAHITAASPSGPRFDPSLSSSERSAVDNGIWLCQNCAKLVDNDPTRYTVNTLKQWKREAEDRARSTLENADSLPGTTQASDMQQQRRQKIANWRKAVEAEKYDFIDYRSRFLSSAVYSSLRPHLLPEVVAKIEAPRIIYVGGARGDHVRQYMLLDEITRIELEWGLI